MDFSTISKRIDDNHYTTMEQFERDFNLVIGNCLRYNAPDTIYYRAALKMRDQGRPIVRAARRQVERAGIDPVTGLHTEEPPTLADREPTEEGIEKIINRSDNSNENNDNNNSGDYDDDDNYKETNNDNNNNNNNNNNNYCCYYYYYYYIIIKRFIFTRVVIHKSLRMLKTMFRKHQTAMELDKVVDIPAKIMASYAMYNVQCLLCGELC